MAAHNSRVPGNQYGPSYGADATNGVISSRDVVTPSPHLPAWRRPRNNIEVGSPTGYGFVSTKVSYPYRRVVGINTQYSSPQTLPHLQSYSIPICHRPSFAPTINQCLYRGRQLFPESVSGNVSLSGFNTTVPLNYQDSSRQG